MCESVSLFQFVSVDFVRGLVPDEAGPWTFFYALKKPHGQKRLVGEGGLRLSGMPRSQADPGAMVEAIMGVLSWTQSEEGKGDATSGSS